ncbi:MAG: helix-turn-helix transcriptional regulator [Lachnospiraceae bacterium]|nr:helix-turn-helix transcriptional regulator [Lachnospiraceae bacterium]
MISYEKLWLTMKEKGISQYALINKYHVSAGQLSRLRKNSYISTHTVDTLCNILNCQVEDIMTHVKESPEQAAEL